ncbi:MAG: S24/S26 family peptidase [Bdellovibrionales bacterium]|nr:S24/S26 family peptidase [Bdellovibrionales bacterium]
MMVQMDETQFSYEQFLELKKKLNQAGSRTIQVISPSMEPWIRVGEELLVLPLEDHPRAFDIIVFWQDHRLVAHCVWKFRTQPQSQAETFSLNYLAFDPPVSEDRILGKVEGKKIRFLDRLRISLKLRIFR